MPELTGETWGDIAAHVLDLREVIARQNARMRGLINWRERAAESGP